MVSMNNIADDIKSSCEERLDFINRIVSDTNELLKTFKNERIARSKSLNDFLSETRKSQASAYTAAKKKRLSEIKNLKKTISSGKAEIKNFKSKLSKSRELLARNVDDLLKDSENMRQKKYNEMMNSISTEMHDLGSYIHQMLNRFKEDRLEMSKSWEDMSKKLSSYRVVGVERAKEMEAAEAKRIKQEQAEAERKRREQEEAMKKQREWNESKVNILEAITEKEMKLTEIGNVVGKAWQGLIPVVNELIDENKLEKDEAGFYYLKK